MNMMPTLQSHTHCQAAQAKRTSRSLPKSVSFPSHGRKESTIAQHCISVMRAELLNMGIFASNKLSGGRTVIRSKTRTTLILDRYSFFAPKKF